jgi:hypothetical protein
VEENREDVPGSRTMNRLTVEARRPVSSLGILLLSLLGASFVVGCGDNGSTPPPGSLRFGQIGEIRVTVASPLLFGKGEGELQQILTWGSSGAWVLREQISYRGLVGDESVRRSTGDPRAYASAYASLITQLNEAPGLELFIPDLPQGLPEACPQGWTHVTVSIWDQAREKEAAWTRCTQGTLATVQTSEAGPDLSADRVIQAAILVRDFTQGSRFASTYVGSVPFGTLDRADDSGARLAEPQVFASVPEGNPQSPTGWEAFWQAHRAVALSSPPTVDWAREMVVVAAVGSRSEAGDSVEVRRILQTGEGTQIQVVERVPGDFCSPAAREQYPVHVVVAPRTRAPFAFDEIVVERVPCGI